TIILSFVISRNYAYFSFIFHSDLRRSDDMSCRMQRYLDAINVNGFMVGKTLYGNVDADTAFQYRYRKMMAQVIFHTPACVVGMPMCHHSEIYRLPRVNKKIARYTINTFLSEL